MSRVSDYRALSLKYEFYIKVPCCGECNIILSNELNANLLEREAVLKNLLADKYKKLLNSKTWTNDDMEFAQLRGNLKRLVRAHKNQKRRVEDRLDYAGGVRAFLKWLQAEGLRDVALEEDEPEEDNATRR